ncbi:MAG: hypothetical protein Q9163_006281 [Psora crenata]
MVVEQQAAIFTNYKSQVLPTFLDQKTQFKIGNMKLSDLIPIQEGIYELEKGRSERSFREGDIIVIRFGSIETDLAPNKIMEDAEIFLETIRVASDGSYTDEDGKEQKLTSAHMEVIVKMTTGQRLMIVNAKDDGSLGQNKGMSRRQDTYHNTHGTDTASATYSEIIEGSSSPITARPDFEVVAE